MPEGDTIRRLAERINRRFAGQRCQRCVTRDPRLVHVDLAGAVLRRRRRRRQAPADPLRRRPHAVRPPADGRLVRRRAGVDGTGVAAAGRAVDGERPADRASTCPSSAWSPPPTRTASSATSAPTCADPSRPTSTRSSARLAGGPTSRSPGALLDQRNVAGFGNVYAVELPFVVGVSPNQPVGTVDGLAGLLGLGTAVIRTNAARGPQNTTGRRLQHDDHWIYRRRGRLCPVCATPLDGWEERESPWRRVSTWCPSLPAASRSPDRRPRPRPPTPRPPPGPPRTATWPR